MASDLAHQVAERAARESYGRLVAFLAARTGDVAGAEDALAEAFAAALETWSAQGPPANPDAWLLTVARRRQTDAQRRSGTVQAGEAHLSLIAEELEGAATGDEIPDRRLALMFACAHPDIEPGLRAPLILQTLLGLTAADIAAAFLVPPAAMGQRLVRAKARIKAAEIPFAIPGREDLPARMAAVLEAVYAAYTLAWREEADPVPPRLAQEAIWLGQVLATLLPDAPEAKGVLALMLYSEARRAARRTPDGAYAPLETQDTTLWDHRLIVLAERLLSEANAGGPTGRYQIEAAIQSAHMARRLAGEDTWPQIVALYDLLLAHAPSPVVVLNRAVARARTVGAETALADLEPLSADRRMAGYQPYWAARGQLCAEAGRRAQAREALTLALGLSTDPAVRGYLQAQIARLLDA